MKRRAFLAAAAGAAGLAALPKTLLAALPSTGRYYSGYGDKTGGYGVALFNQDGSAAKMVPSPGRLHDVLLRPGSQQLVAVARRPGTFAQVLDLESAKEIKRLETKAGRHFYGHALFSTDGKTLFITENDYEAGLGLIAVYDAAAGYKKVAELPSHGIGPHQMAFHPDGHWLAIANGGIVTHPDTGRAVLNLDEMQPSLSIVSADGQRLLKQVPLPEALTQLSLRHLAVNKKGVVAFGLQNQVKTMEQPPLVGLWSEESGLHFAETPPEGWAPFKGYIGSICLDAGDGVVAASSPRGGRIGFWQLDGGKYLGSLDLADGCGLAPTARAGEFLLTSGSGQVDLATLSSGSPKVLQNWQTGIRWDNHIKLSVL